MMLAGAMTACSAGTGGIQVPAHLVDSVRAAGQTCPAISPKLIAAQLQQESGWDRRAVSPAGAQGIAQFMPDTWREWGRDLDGDGIADPFDAKESIDAQGRFMCYLHAQAVSSGIRGKPVVLALAGYNAGWAPVQRYRGVPPYPETREYVRRIMNTWQSVELPKRR